MMNIKTIMARGLRSARTLFVFAGILLANQSYSGQNFYVSPQGSDSNNGSITLPWKNLAFAVRRVSAGDTIVMRGGTHIVGEVWIDRNKGMGGRPGQYLTIKAYPGEEPILQPGRRRLILWADYVRVEGLHFIMPWRCDAFGGGLQIINNKFTGPQPKFGAIETGGTDILVEGNFIEYDDTGGNTQDHGIYVHAGERIIIRDNTVIGSKGYGIHVFDEHKSADPAEWAANPFVMRDYVLEGNFVAESQERSGLIIAKGRGGNYITLENMTVGNNVFVGNAQFGLFIREGENIKVYNNTLYLNAFASLLIRYPSPEGGGVPASDITIVNNIFVTPVSKAHVRNTSSGANLVLQNNLYNSSPFLEGITDPNAIVGDPQFVDPRKYDFHLQASSPAIDAGIDVGLPFQGSAPDLGAYEFDESPTGVEESESQPKRFYLHQNYPNPFNPETKIVYDVLAQAHITINVYALTGRKVETLVNEEKASGSYVVQWDGKDARGKSVPSGIYFYRLEVLFEDNHAVFRDTKRMILLR
ncbi:T9SS type A sorting domain-containing protein [candidate division KSB1 bacterium]|nr:T9SS type A sorting domain-containing protein [candidate division KSB1 bacterium]NIR71681.1 T9SS type A sorting domain-containing protein [candidate division KSB1 bacterium]NIS26393.1 T9SS type A sorting domain-containing protein [candidate division KSB1 bacterium]NIT73152.1 T9SS type A sorting domain-containing protein [candidate division KSB1 bacterium]NIU27079.1 T9SS type A sorting domain-containing protein [candidate division KSB1 bacterium]